MNFKHENELARTIDRELKALPEIQAPSTLSSRVLSAIERRAVAPWYRRAWQTWPVPLQAAAILFLSAFAGGACFGGWEFIQSPSLGTATNSVTHWISSFTTVWTALNALGGLIVLMIKQLNTSVLIGVAVAVALSWAACLGLGTVYIRLALARR